MASPALAYFAFLAIIASATQTTVAQRAADQSEILNCVRTVLADEVPGFLDVTAVSGFRLLEANDLVAAGGRIGKGRVIGLGHDRFLQQEDKSGLYSDRNKFIDNMWKWIHSKQGAQRSVGVVSTQVPSLTSGLAWKPQYGTLSSVKIADVASTKVDVLVIDGNFSKDYAYALTERVRSGMGLVILATNWAYAKKYKNQNQFNFEWGPNIVALASGFQFRRSTDKAGNGRDRNKFSPVIDYQCKGTKGR